MPKYHSASKILFYHLPTRGRAGIKRGDAWYVSKAEPRIAVFPLYLLFWTILGFIFHFYIIFGTNLLTRGPAQNCCFFVYFSVSKKRNIKLSPNGMKPSGMWFSHRTWSRRLGPCSKEQKRRSRGWRVCPLPRGPPVAPLMYSFLLYIPMYPWTIRTGAKNLIPPPQPSVSTRSHLGACSGAPPEGASITEGFYINTIAPPTKCE